MKADAITSRILDDARKEASQGLREAHDRVEKMRRENEETMAQKREQALAKAREDAIELRDRMLRMAELDQRKEYLGMKRQVMDDAFDQALLQMRGMQVDQARRFLSDLLADAAQGDEELIISKADEGVFAPEFLEKVNARLAEMGKASSLKLSEERRELGGGVILRRGGMEVNLTYAAVLGEIRPSLEAEVAAMLFDGQEG